MIRTGRLRLMLNKKEELNYLIFGCPECNRELRICRIQRKRISNCEVFTVYTYYCKHCKLTYFIFRFFNRKKRKGNETM